MQKLVIKNTFYAQASQLVRVVLQAVYFFLIARALSPVGYGSYVSVLALVSFFAAFSSWGSERLMIRDIALDAEGSNIYWGGSLTTLLLI
ncbi:MAG: oligosaccharide flippase family protein, partial [Desulfobulbaceae bacterium]|nr:oligosaccharide flippase family protein [Desulfobulbaceae bacterium]